MSLHWGVAAAAALRQHVPAIVNVHAAAAPAGHPRGDLLEQSLRFFRWAREWCGKNAPDVRPVSELQIAPDAGEPVQRIADNYAELLEIAARSEVGVCWILATHFLTPGVLEPSWIRLRNYLGGFSTFTATMSM